MRIAPMDSAGSKEDRAVSRPLKASVDGEGSQGRTFAEIVGGRPKGCQSRGGCLIRMLVGFPRAW